MESYLLSWPWVVVGPVYVALLVILLLLTSFAGRSVGEESGSERSFATQASSPVCAIGWCAVAFAAAGVGLQFVTVVLGPRSPSALPYSVIALAAALIAAYVLAAIAAWRNHSSPPSSVWVSYAIALAGEGIAWFVMLVALALHLLMTE